MVQIKNKKILVVSAAALLAGVSMVQAANVDTNMARMQAMDKITGKVSEIDVPVGGEAKFGTFSIVVRKCVTRTPEETPENTAFVDVVDNYKSENPVNIFKGWMMSSTPALNAIEHPIYDAWLLNCHEGDTNGKKLLSEAELTARDEILMQRDEEAEVVTEALTESALEETIPTPAPVVEEAVAPVVEETQAEVITVTAEVEAPAEDGAPKSLLQVAVPQQEASVPDVALAPAEAPAPMAETLPQEVVSVAEPIVIEATAPAEDAIPAEPEAENYIQFEEEPEEDGFELNADALIAQ